MQRKTSPLATFALAGASLLAVVAAYVLSAAPLLRLADAGSTVASEGPPRAWEIAYRPLTQAMRSPLVRKPLIPWFDLWVSKETITAAVDGWLTLGGTITSFSVIISCGVEIDEEDEEAATAEITPGDADLEEGDPGN